MEEKSQELEISGKPSSNVKIVLKYISAVILCICAIALIYYLRGVLSPFVFAFLLAYILNPLTTFFENRLRIFCRRPKVRDKAPRGIPRVIATILTLLIVAGVIVLFGFIFIPQISAEFSHFGSLVKKFMADSAWVQKFLALVPDDWRGELQNLAGGAKFLESLQDISFWQTVQSMVGKMLPGAIGVLSGTATVIFSVVSLVFIVMYTTFLMLDMPKITRKVRNFIPAKDPSKPDLLRKINMLMKAYFRSQSLVALIVGTLYSIAFGVIGFPMGIVFGIFIGILNMVPYLQIASMPVAFFLGIIYSFETGMPFWQVLVIIASIYLAVQIIEDMFIIPRIVGSEMNLPPVLILLSISVWGKLLGFIGLVCAIPFTCIIIAMFEKHVEERFFPKKPEEIGKEKM